MPAVTGAAGDHIVVLGDSISAGLGSPAEPWPTIFQRITHTPVRNISQVGASTEDALKMVSSVRAEDRLVLIEIGGNDLIANLPSKQFGEALDQLLSRLAAPGRTIVMFELPLLPYKIEYGRIQRRLARKYGVWLIPKRYFVEVIKGADATSDGLHLTAVGAERMAALTARILAPVLSPPSS